MENDLKSLSETELDKVAREKRLIVMELERRLETEKGIIELIDGEMVERSIKSAMTFNENTEDEPDEEEVQEESEEGLIGEDEEDTGTA